MNRSKIVKCAAAAMLAMLMHGCGSSERDAEGRLVASKLEGPDNASAFTLVECGVPYTFRYVVVDEHEYVICTHDRGVGISHSPRCQCRK